ncbi:TonB family protein [Yoonia sp. GPGPB17]|uniref:TonB family protein n=1 Tax=Yoonia sp. GPGPB17 TaxID=3026147 RepID=UPI0030C44114
MNQAATFAPFLGIALVAHILAWQVLPSGGSQAAGDMGDGAVSLVAVNSALRDVIADWDRPPEVAVSAPEINAPAQPSDRPLAIPISPNPRPNQPAIPLQTPPGADASPDVEKTTPLAPPLTSPRPVSRPTPPPQVAEQAAGGGNAAQAGRGTSATTSAQATTTDPAQMARWQGAIRNAVERRKRYPAGTRARGGVTLRITVSTNGSLISVNIAQSSGNALLDRAGRMAVERAVLPAAPSGIADGLYDFDLLITLRP